MVLLIEKKRLKRTCLYLNSLMAFEFFLGTSGREVHPLWEGLPLPFSKYFLTNPSKPPWLRRFLFLPMKKAMSRPVPSLRPLMERQYCTCKAFTSKRHAQFLSYLDRKKSGFFTTLQSDNCFGLSFSTVQSIVAWRF